LIGGAGTKAGAVNGRVPGRLEFLLLSITLLVDADAGSQYKVSDQGEWSESESP